MAVSKGTISALYEGGKKAAIKPYMGEIVTPELVVPFFLFDCLEVGMPVVYASFEDGTGIVLARMDGEWNHKLEDGVEISTGDLRITAGDLSTSGVTSYNNHKHSCPEGTTSGPV